MPDRGPDDPLPPSAVRSVELRLELELAPGVALAIALPAHAIALSPQDVEAIRAASQPLVAELAKRGITPHDKEQP